MVFFARGRGLYLTHLLCIMSEKTPNPVLTPAWLREAPVEVREQGDKLYRDLIEMLLHGESEYYLSEEGCHDREYGEYGILKQACVGYEMHLYRLAKDSVSHAAEELGARKDEAHGANKATFRKIYGVARILGRNRVSLSTIRDSINDEIVTGNLYPWLKAHPDVGANNLIVHLVDQHVRRRHTWLPDLDERVCMRMPQRVVDDMFMPNNEGDTYVLWELQAEDLPLEGVMMENCVGEDRWVREVQEGKTRIFSFGREIPNGETLSDLGDTERKLYLEKINPFIDWDAADLDDPNLSYSYVSDEDRQRVSVWAHKTAHTKVCRAPLVTVEYDVEKKYIMQIEGHENEKIDPDSAFAAVVIDVIVKLSEKVPINEIFNAGKEFGEQIMARIMSAQD